MEFACKRAMSRFEPLINIYFFYLSQYIPVLLRTNLTIMQQDESKREDISFLKSENALTYQRPSNVALVNERLFKTYNFTSQVNQLGSTPMILLNTGSDSIWGPTSYLRLQYTAAAALNFGTGSVLNIFRSIRLTSRSGEILEFIDNVGLLAGLLRYHDYSDEDRHKLDGMLGVATTKATAAATYSNIPGASTSHIALIPMSILCGVFGNHDQMIPASLAAGMKIELELQPIQQVSVTNGGVDNGTLMTDLQFTMVVDSSQLYDVVTRDLLEQQSSVSSSGLQFTYKTFFNSVTTPGIGSTAVNIDVQQSASMVSRIIMAARDNVQLNTVLGNNYFNKYKTQQYFSQAQFRLGSSYWPQAQVITPGGNWNDVQKNSKEWYNYGLVASMASFDPFHKSSGKAANIKFVDPTSAAGGGNNANSFTSGKAMLSFIGEKSPVGLEMTGSVTNNSQLLTFTGTINSLMGTNGVLPATVDPEEFYTLTEIRVDTYLESLRVVNILGQNTIVDR